MAFRHAILQLPFHCKPGLANTIARPAAMLVRAAGAFAAVTAYPLILMAPGAGTPTTKLYCIQTGDSCAAGIAACSECRASSIRVLKWSANAGNVV